MPMTALEQWEMAKALDVPLWIVKQTEKNFWDYIETPKGKAKHYKTTYKTVKKWIEMKLQKGEFQHCNETEKLQLDMQHPDLVKKQQELIKWAKEQKIVE
jgi:phosphoribulokinase